MVGINCSLDEVSIRKGSITSSLLFQRRIIDAKSNDGQKRLDLPHKAGVVGLGFGPVRDAGELTTFKT